MTIFCLEISAEPGVLGLVRDTELIAEYVLTERRQFSAALDNLFAEETRIAQEISALAVGIGPGSFTGLRVALAFAKGLALARALPIWPLSSHAIYAANVRNQAETIAVISQARRGQFHCSRFSAPELTEVVPRTIINEDQLVAHLAPGDLLTGPSAASLAPEISRRLLCRVATDSELLRPHAATIADLARNTWGHKQPPDADLLLPDYGLEFGTM